MKKYFSTIYRLWTIITPFHGRFYLQLFFIFVAQLIVIADSYLNSSILNSLAKRDLQNGLQRAGQQ